MKSAVLSCICLILLIAASSDAAVYKSSGTEIEVTDWKVTLYATPPKESGGYFPRLKYFNMSFEVFQAGEYYNLSGLLPTSTLLSELVPSTTVFNWTDHNGVTVRTIEQKARLLSDVDFTFTVEQFFNESWKDVAGWRMPESTFGCKFSARFENMSNGAIWNYYPNVHPASYLYINVTLNGMVPLNYSLNPGPVDAYPVLLNERTDPNVAPPESVEVINFVANERRFNYSMKILSVNTRQGKTGIETVRIKDMNLPPLAYYAENILAQLADISVPLHLDIPLFVGMSPGNFSDWVEWDPDFTILFDLNIDQAQYELFEDSPSVLQIPTSNVEAPFGLSTPAIGAIAAVGGAVLLVGLFLIVAWTVPGVQRHVFPLRWKKLKVRPQLTSSPESPRPQTEPVRGSKWRTVSKPDLERVTNQ